MIKEYSEKRDFSRTPEPPPAQAPGGGGPLIFVVQKHSARRLHYDFRLEVDGALKSWSVPSGPSLDPKVKRLAVMVEDHPLDYASFEGSIPKREYGAGQVIVWDKGDYSPDEGGRFSFDDREEAQKRMVQGLSQGKLSIYLRGHKIKGSWTLVKMKRGQNDWLLIKHQDDFAGSGYDILEKSASVLSGLTVEDLKAGHRLSYSSSHAIGLSDIPGVRKGALPSTISPMLAGNVDAPFSDPEWIFEPKLDGYRTIAVITDGSVRLLSRHGLDVTQKYSSIVESLRRQPAAEMVLDGEIIALDKRGRLCFQCLQGYLESMGRTKGQDEETAAIIYYVFDILHLDEYALDSVPLVERKKILDRVLRPSQSVRPLEYFEGDGVAIYRGVVEQGLEGVVAKRKDSYYEAGRRSSDWLKIKSVQTDDFIIGGYTQGTGNRGRTFGALLLGYYDNEGRLVSAGHVGTGFDDHALADLKRRLDAIKTDRCPFAEPPEVNAPAAWVSPELVAEVKFSQWTQDGKLRAPVYLRLRDDKPANQVHRSQSVLTTASRGRNVDLFDEAVSSVLKQLENSRNSFAVDVQGYRVNLSNLEKVLWPAFDERPALTKRDLLIYLAKVSPHLLRHLQDRPLTLSRYPDGIYGQHFFQKHWNSPVPDFVKTVMLSEHSKKRQEYLLCNNLPTLIWLGQVADIEFHCWFSKVSPEPDREPSAANDAEAMDFLTRFPDFIIFDLDPYIFSGKEPSGVEPELSREGFARTCEAALWLKETLDSLSLASFVKTSGRTGLHIYVPVLRQLDFHAVHSAAKTICQFVLQRHPKAVTTEWAVERRSGKVFLDYNQNLRGKTLASVYSPRPAPEATVSVPLRWDELGKVYPTDFTILNTPDRLTEVGDLWENILDAKRDVKHLLKVA